MPRTEITVDGGAGAKGAPRDNEVDLTIKLRGTPTSVVGALVNGLPPAALQRISDKLNQHIAKRARAARSAAAKRSAATRAENPERYVETIRAANRWSATRKARS